MSETKASIIIFVNALILAVVSVIGAGVLHDNAIMRERLDAMQQTQVEQSKEIHQAKTDAEIALRIVTTGEWEK